MKPDEKWLAEWQNKRNMLTCPNDLNEYFKKGNISGKNIDVMNIGKVSIPSGNVIVRDPLVYLNEKAEPYFIKTPAGNFSVEICVIEPSSDGDCARYAAARVKFNENNAVKFEEALVGNENLADLQEGRFFGFNVDAGLGCITDSECLKYFCDFQNKFYKENPDANLYDDYFSEIFEESYKQNPKYQRKGGDWINWKIPGTDYTIPFFQSGFGDGTYPVYFGFDKDGKVCALVIQFIDIELAYGDDDEDGEEND